MNEQLLQQILALLTGQNPTTSAFTPPSGGLQVPVDLNSSIDPTGISAEPDTLAQNAQNVSLDQLNSNTGGPVVYSPPSGSPAGLQSGPGLFGGAGAAASALGGPSGGLAGAAGALESPQASGSDFDFKAAGSAVTSAMNTLASSIAKQGQQGMQQAMALVTKGGTDPRLRALMQPVAPLGGTPGIGDINQAALQQLLALFLPQR